MRPFRTTVAICVAALLLPALQSSADEPPLVGDGKTATLTHHGTWIVPPPGSPMTLLPPDPESSSGESLPWGAPGVGEDAGPEEPGSGSPDSCTNRRAGWFVTDTSSMWGGHMGVIPQNMPPNFSWYCAGTGMGYTDGVTFGTNNWIQAGLAIFKDETGAKWFCQSNNNGAKDTRYGTASAYANGATVYTWFARDSSGVWRTYRYDSGPYAVELGCTITRGASDALQVVGEIQGATSTSAPMGPWRMFDLRYLGTNNQWYVPTQLQAQYPGGTPCPPYGAGTVSGGYVDAGSGKACTTGTKPYPN